MTIFFPDISSYEHGLTIQPGTVAVIAKATEGTYYRDAEYENFKAQAARIGAIFSAYHFLKAGGGAAQADYCHAMVGSTPVMLDVETEGASKPTVADCAAFIARMRELGGRVWGAYFPRWFWGQVGGDLGSLGVAIVSSAYTSYSDSGPGWQPYGGVTPTIWQFTSSWSYGGQSVDLNAYRGTVDELAALINGTTPTRAPDPAPTPAPPPAPSSDPEDDNMPAFATGEIKPGDGVVTMVCPPPANLGAAGWGNVWFSLGSDFGEAHVRVAIYTHGQGWSNIYEDVLVRAVDDRVNPFGGPLPTGVQKISITRNANPDVPLAYLIEATHR
jgi:hypothetical protein